MSTVLANDRDPPHTFPPSRLGVLMTHIRRASVSALALSLLIHALALLLAALVVIGHGGTGDGVGGGDPGGPMEMAVVTEGELSQLQDQAMGVQTPTVPEAPMKDIEVVTNITDAGPADAGGRTGDQMGDVGPLAGGGDISLGGGDAAGAGLGGSGGGGASFFGVEAQGNRFAYLVDVSGSMDEPVAAQREGTRIQALRAELTRSTQSLMENSQFMVVRFSSDADVLGGKAEWSEASPNEKKRFRTLITTLEAGGGTNPLPGFEMIFRLKPRPDAIYFMTDGQFDNSVVEEVAGLYEKFKVPVHCICLGSKEGEDNMRRIAKLTHGTFHFIGGSP